MEDTPMLGETLAQFAAEVRESTLKRLRAVQPADRGWSSRADLLSFADALQHLVDADRWLIDWMDGRGSSPGVDIQPGIADPAKWDILLEEFARLGRLRSQRLAALTPRDFAERRFDLGRRGVKTLWQLILRCNIDHEIQHRGALQLALRLRYG